MYWQKQIFVHLYDGETIWQQPKLLGHELNQHFSCVVKLTNQKMHISWIVGIKTTKAINIELLKAMFV